jgi:hypothetical protein
LDPRFHYILGGIYTSIIQEDVWVMAMGIKKNEVEEGTGTARPCP